MIIRIIQQKALIGSEISVFLKTGEEIRGTLIEIGESHICVRNSDGEETLFSDVIGRFKVHTKAEDSQINSSSMVLEASKTPTLFIDNPTHLDQNNINQKLNYASPSSPSTETSSATSSLTPTSEIATYSSEFITKVKVKTAEIKARFQTAIEQTEITPFTIKLEVPEAISSLSYSSKKKELLREWDRLQNKYNHAVKTRDLSRLNDIILGYEKLIEKYPNLAETARYNVGCLYLELGNITKALEAFEREADNSKNPQVFYNMAVTALRRKDTAKACYGLQEFFKQTSIQDHTSAWYQFLGLALEAGIVEVLTELLKEALQQYKREDAQWILESGVFVLQENNQTDHAYELMAFFLENKDNDLELEQAPELLNLMLSQLNLEPTLAYRQQKQELQKAQEEAKHREELAKRQKEVKSLISHAEQSARKGNYSQAISELRRALQLDPENSLAQKIEAEYCQEHRERSLLRAGNGLYAQARRAEILDQDLKKAEKLYREAIKKGDKAESAVKDLASLYWQQDRDNEAIKLLEDYRSEARNKQAFLNILSEAYQRIGNYRQQIECLQEILDITPYEKQAIVYKRISLAQFKSKEYKQSKQTLERVLRLAPQDEVAKSWYKGLEEAETTGTYTDLDKLFVAQEAIEDPQTSLSDFLSFHIEGCKYTGVDASKIASKKFSDRDAKKLREDAEKLGTKPAMERASYFLSAAKILMDLGNQAEDHRTRLDLRNFCAAMGDACIAEKKPRDVVASYYAEAFIIAPAWVPQLEFKVTQYILLYCSTQEKLADNLLRKTPDLKSCLAQALKMPQGGTSVIERLWDLSRLNLGVSRFLIDNIYPKKDLRNDVQKICRQILSEPEEEIANEAAFLALWERGKDFVRQRHQKVLDEIAYLNSAVRGLDSIQEQKERVQKLINTIRVNLDQERLKKIKAILDYVYDYSQQPYTERERLITIIQNRVTELVEEIEKNPTKYSLELFCPYLRSLGTTISEHFQDIQLAAEPEELKTGLSIDKLPNTTDVQCQITIANEEGKSPANSIKIEVQDSSVGEYEVVRKSISVIETLAGGKSVTCQIPVKTTEIARESQVFTLYYQLIYITRTGKKIQSEHQEAIRLYLEEEFQLINNPYADYAQGVPVKQKTMFYGRDPLMANLVSSICNASSAKSFIIYGQKRTGKSSILYHLQKQLPLPIIPVSFSIGEILEDLSTATFLYKIIQNIESKIDDLTEEKGYPEIHIQRPSLAEMQKNSSLIFEDYMSNLRKILRKKKEYENAKIMLLIDEFSYIYGEIILGRIKDNFMKFWKALLEKGHFGAVLVGQDVMPKFIARFANEFQVAESQRVSYLASDDARQLIIEPIRIPDTGESRYKGEAVKRLIDLTAGNPYYIQIFCNRLVNYMNRKKAIYVTDADIEQVKDDLISGNNSLTDNEFDNLLNATEDNVDEITKADSEAVLRDIAKGSKIQDYCERSDINVETSVPIDKILEDLQVREVIEKKEKEGRLLFRIRVELFKEWLLEH